MAASSVGLLRPWFEDPASAGVFTDFDGTLAPIVDDPASAWPLPGVPALLGRLAQRYRRVAVISGRPLTYLLDKLGAVPGVELAGLYGLERAEGGDVVELPAAKRWRAVVATVAEEAEAAAPPGVGVERKGLALTLHARKAPQHATWVVSFSEAQAAVTGLEAHRGKMSVEMRPPVGADKGTVLSELAGGLSAVCFLGDDLGDLPAFAALAAMRREGITTLAVAVSGPEAPEALCLAADLTVDGPEGAAGLLEELAGP